MFHFRLISVPVALLFASVSFAFGQTNEDTANRLLIDAATGSGGASDPLYKRRLLSVLVEEFPETAAARSVALGTVSIPDLPDSPEFHQLLVEGSGITGFEHGEFPSYGATTHPGIDIGLPGQVDCGLPVTAPLSGSVVRVVASDVPDSELELIGIDRARSDRDFGHNTGNAVILRHGNTSSTYSIYLHLQSTPSKSNGEPWRIGMTVPAGAQIGKIGDTGAAEGCHLHFEARNFEGTYKYLHPAFGNIYPPGDISDTDVFVEDWIDPESFLRRAFLDRHLATEDPVPTSVGAVPAPEFPGTHAESTAQTTGIATSAEGPTESEIRPGDWIETSEARRVVRTGETVGDLSIDADGSTRYRKELLFSAATDPAATEVRLFFSPDARSALVIQWDLDWGGLRAALINLGTRQILKSDLVPETAVRGKAEAMNVRQPMLPVAWSPDSKYAAIPLSLAEWQADLLLIDAETGNQAVLKTDELQPGQWSLPKLETLRWDADDWASIDYDVLACSDTDCTAPKVVGSISGGHRITHLLKRATTQPVTTSGEEWTAAIVHSGGYGRPELTECMWASEKSTVECLRDDGASEETLRFAHARAAEGGEGPEIPIDFRELGKVDIAVLDALSMNGNRYDYFVNTSPETISYPIYPERELSILASRGDRRAQSILAQFPGATAWKPFIGGMRILPNGDQRFSTAVYWTESCRACPIVGYNIATVDYDHTGRLSASQNRGVFDNAGLGGRFYNQYTADDLRRHPKLVQFFLNLRGYEAGPMDGVTGARTEQALREFQRENGLHPVTGQSNWATIVALSDMDTVFRNGSTNSTGTMPQPTITASATSTASHPIPAGASTSVAQLTSALAFGRQQTAVVDVNGCELLVYQREPIKVKTHSAGGWSDWMGSTTQGESTVGEQTTITTVSFGDIGRYGRFEGGSALTLVAKEGRAFQIERTTRRTDNPNLNTSQQEPIPHLVIPLPSHERYDIAMPLIRQYMDTCNTIGTAGGTVADYPDTDLVSELIAHEKLRQHAARVMFVDGAFEDAIAQGLVARMMQHAQQGITNHGNSGEAAVTARGQAQGIASATPHFLVMAEAQPLSVVITDKSDASQDQDVLTVDFLWHYQSASLVVQRFGERGGNGRAQFRRREGSWRLESVSSNGNGLAFPTTQAVQDAADADIISTRNEGGPWHFAEREQTFVPIEGEPLLTSTERAAHADSSNQSLAEVESTKRDSILKLLTNNREYSGSNWRYAYLLKGSWFEFMQGTVTFGLAVEELDPATGQFRGGIQPLEVEAGFLAGFRILTTELGYIEGRLDPSSHVLEFDYFRATGRPGSLAPLGQAIVSGIRMHPRFDSAGKVLGWSSSETDPADTTGKFGEATGVLTISNEKWVP